mgnify:CR=1 FL=1
MSWFICTNKSCVNALNEKIRVYSLSFMLFLNYHYVVKYKRVRNTRDIYCNIHFFLNFLVFYSSLSLSDNFLFNYINTTRTKYYFLISNDIYMIFKYIIIFEYSLLVGTLQLYNPIFFSYICIRMIYSII